MNKIVSMLTKIAEEEVSKYVQQLCAKYQVTVKPIKFHSTHESDFVQIVYSL